MLNLSNVIKDKILLIFDFDGTLANTSPLHEAAFNTVLAQWGFNIDYPSVAGMRSHDAILACFAKAGLVVSESQLQQLTLSKQACVRALIQKELRPLPMQHNLLLLMQTQEIATGTSKVAQINAKGAADAKLLIGNFSDE